jgi:hypothetical protein
MEPLPGTSRGPGQAPSYTYVTAVNTVFGVTSGIAGALACPWYIRRAEPDRTSWLSWLLAYTFLLAAQLADGAIATLWLNGTEWAATLLICVFTWRRGTGTVSRRTVVMLGGECLALAAWWVTTAAIGTVLMLTVIAAATLPTVGNAYRNPNREPSLAWCLMALAGILGELAVRPGSAVASYAYPDEVTVMAIAVITAAAIGPAARRRNAGSLGGAGREALTSAAACAQSGSSPGRVDSSRPSPPPGSVMAGTHAQGRTAPELLATDAEFPCLLCQGKNAVPGRAGDGGRVQVPCPWCGSQGKTRGLDYCAGERHASGSRAPATHVIVSPAGGGRRSARLVCPDCAQHSAAQIPPGQPSMAFALVPLPAGPAATT